MDFVLAFPEQLGLHLKSLRKAAGLRQAELAALIGVSQSRVAAIEKDPASVSVGQFLSILKLLNAELVIRQQDPARNRMPSREQALGTSASDDAKQQIQIGRTGSEKSAADYLHQHDLTGRTGLERVLGRSATDYVKKHVPTVPTVTLKPQDLPADWQSKKPKGSW